MSGRAGAGSAGAFAASALLALGTAGCCVAPPRAADLLAVGFRTPEQTLATFQTAVRADDPELQRRCFSARFQEQNRVSSLAWREFWEALVREEPFLRRGLVDARVRARDVRGGRARIEAETHGRVLALDLVLDDFCEVWAGGEKVRDEISPFGERTAVQSGPDGRRWIVGRAELPEGSEPSAISELRFGREWKIDGFEMLDGGAARGAPPRRGENDDLF